MISVPDPCFAHGQQQQQHVACPGHHEQHMQLGPDMQQLLIAEPLDQYTQPEGPESRSLYNSLVSQLSMAACEVQLDQMSLRTASSISAASSSTTSSFSASSMHNSISGPSVTSSRPDSMGSSSSPPSDDAFQQLLYQLLQEEWATHSPQQKPSQ
jgi:hypothetical protein